MGQYNLLDEPWIAVMPADGGQAKTVSLLTLFREAHRCKRLAGEMVTQDFAVLRLLLAVLTTVFSRLDADGKPYSFVELDERFRQTNDVDEDDLEEEDEFEEAMAETWQALWQRGAFPEIVATYLEAWRDRFYLFDETYPFYQVRIKDLINEKAERDGDGEFKSVILGKTINRTISESDHKVALFSPINDSDKNKLSNDEFARWLITVQSYLGVQDKGKFLEYPKTAEDKISKGWLFELGGICITGDTLFETLMLNLVLEHPENQYKMTRQRPCWEFDSGEFLKKLMRSEQPDNLAELYTNWCRAVYINPKMENASEKQITAVKFRRLKLNQPLEPMTVWRLPNKNNVYVPEVHKPEQAIWRSFGLITMEDTSTNRKRPGIISWLNDREIQKIISERKISIWAISMLAGGSSSSQIPVDEIVDVLNLNEMLITDHGDDGWCVRVNEAVVLTKKIVEKVYRAYIHEIAIIRNIGKDVKRKPDPKREAYIESQTEDLYAQIDGPFREWLEAIRPENDKDEQIHRWQDTLKRLVLQRAREILDAANHRDFIGITDDNDHTKNIATAYNWFCARLNRQFSN